MTSILCVFAPLRETKERNTTGNKLARIVIDAFYFIHTGLGPDLFEQK